MKRMLIMLFAALLLWAAAQPAFDALAEEQKRIEFEIKLDESAGALEVRVVSQDDAWQAKLDDIAGHWAEERIRTSVELCFTTGYEDGTFRPDKPITRAEFATLLVRALQLPVATELPFGDKSMIPVWARAAVASAAGYEDDTFRPSRLINRSEMAAMIVRALDGQPPGEAAPGFADDAQIPNWAKSYVKHAYDEKLKKAD